MRTKALLALAGIALLASGCTLSRAASMSATSDMSGDGPITVAVSEQHATDTFRGQVEVWNSQHPEETVTISVLPKDPIERYNQVRIDAHDGEKAIVEVNTTNLAEFAGMGWLAKLPESAFDTSQFFSASLSATRSGSDMYAAPFSVDTLSLHYRKDLVPTPPESWGELTDICAAHPEQPCLRAPLRSGDGMADTVLSLTSAQNGDFTNIEPVLDQLTSGPVVERELPMTAQRTAFAGGNGLFMLDGIEGARALAGDDRFATTDAMLSPTGKPLLSVSGLAITDSTFHKKTALDFLTFIADSEHAKTRSENDGIPSAYPGLYRETSNPYLSMLTTVFTQHTTALSRPAGNWTTSVEQTLQQVFVGEQTANDACHTLASLLPSG